MQKDKLKNRFADSHKYENDILLFSEAFATNKDNLKGDL